MGSIYTLKYGNCRCRLQPNDLPFVLSFFLLSLNDCFGFVLLLVVCGGFFVFLFSQQSLASALVVGTLKPDSIKRS